MTAEQPMTDLDQMRAAIEFGVPEQLEIRVLRNAAAIRQERKWWCEWIEDLQCFTVRGAGFIHRDDGSQFRGPDSETPLIEADEYYKERGR